MAHTPEDYNIASLSSSADVSNLALTFHDSLLQTLRDVVKLSKATSSQTMAALGGITSEEGTQLFSLAKSIIGEKNSKKKLGSFLSPSPSSGSDSSPTISLSPPTPEYDPINNYGRESRVRGEVRIPSLPKPPSRRYTHQNPQENIHQSHKRALVTLFSDAKSGNKKYKRKEDSKTNRKDVQFFFLKKNE